MYYKTLKAFLCLALIALLFSACQKDNLEELLPTSEPATTIQPLVSKQATDLSRYIVVLKKENFKDFDSRDKMAYAVRQARVKEEALTVLTDRFDKQPAINHIYAKSIFGFTADLTATEATDLTKDGRVAFVEKDQVMKIFTTATASSVAVVAQEVPYGITRVGGGFSSGNGTAWIIDTGIDLDHPDLNVDVDRSRSFVSATPLGIVRVFSPNDLNGHGTHVAGTVAALDNNEGVIGVAPGAPVVAVQVLGAAGNGFNSDVIAGVDYVGANAAPGDVVNMSLGGGVSPALDDAVLNAASNGIIFALAAGNDSEHSENSSPGRVNGENIYTISAHDSNDNFASFSNFGNPPVDYCAPGVNIRSTYLNGGYSSLSGTSMATPHVAGLLLLGPLQTDGFVNGDPDGTPDPIAHH